MLFFTVARHNLERPTSQSTRAILLLRSHVMRIVYVCSLDMRRKRKLEASSLYVDARNRTKCDKENVSFRQLALNHEMSSSSSSGNKYFSAARTYSYFIIVFWCRHLSTLRHRSSFSIDMPCHGMYDMHVGVYVTCEYSMYIHTCNRLMYLSKVVYIM